MSKAVSYKKRFLTLTAVVVIFGFLSYNLAISKTLTEKEINKNLIQKLGQINTVDSDLRKYQVLNNEIDKELGGGVVMSGGFHQALLEVVGRFCSKNDLVLTEFSEPVQGLDKGYLVETTIITVSGRFKPLLQLVDHMEKEVKLGRVASVDFFKKKNYRRNREELYVKIFMQKLSKNENN